MNYSVERTHAAAGTQEPLVHGSTVPNFKIRAMPSIAVSQTENLCLTAEHTDVSPKAQHSLTISIVSHGQGLLVQRLLEDIEQYCKRDIEVLLTLNVPERLPFQVSTFSFPLTIIENRAVRGFAANHNQAFRHASSSYFCIANPDVRLMADPFPALKKALDDSQVGVVGPAVINSNGEIEASARQFPTPTSIFRKVIAWKPLHDYEGLRATYEPDWIAGTFMIFKRETFTALNGFDEQYFLYYEDVDICARLRSAGFRVVLEPQASIIHDPSRRSWHNPYYTLIHLRSMLRFFQAMPLHRKGASVNGSRS